MPGSSRVLADPDRLGRLRLVLVANGGEESFEASNDAICDYRLERRRERRLLVVGQRGEASVVDRQGGGRGGLHPFPRCPRRGDRCLRQDDPALDLPAHLLDQLIDQVSVLAREHQVVVGGRCIGDLLAGERLLGEGKELRPDVGGDVETQPVVGVVGAVVVQLKGEDLVGRFRDRGSVSPLRSLDHLTRLHDESHRGLQQGYVL